MRVPLSWLKDYVDITLPIEEVSERLTLAGFEVDSIEYIGVPSANPHATHLVWDREKILVGEVLEVRPHPNADRLVLADVNYGAATPHVVVTGAPNLFAYKGQGRLERPLKVIFAREGARVYDGHQPGRVLMTLKPAKIRGVPSTAMVCSEKELGLSEEHDGILFLPDDAPVGTPLADYLGDIVLEVALTPNLARAFSIVGIAREVAALTGQTLRYPSLEYTATGAPLTGQVDLRIEAPALNPRFTLALIKGVKIGPSPWWLQRRLTLAGMRPINNIVDVSNYVMLELGQPTHAFDYTELVRRADGHTPTITTRLAQPNETITTLDGQARALPAHAILVTDSAGALSVGGIMGGAESEVRATTTDILLEAAAWELINIRQTSAALQLNSEAGFRFSRGVHPAQAKLGLLRGISLMHQLAGGEIASGILDLYPQPPVMPTLTLTPREVERVLGITLSAQRIADLLTPLEFHCALGLDVGTETFIQVTPPDHRLDIGGVEDLLEEVARMYGYDRIPLTRLADELPPQRTNTALLLEERTRDALVEAGLHEIISYALVTPEREAQLLPGLAPDVRPYVRVANPISAERTVMRHTLLTALLETLAQNLRHHARVALFEIGRVFIMNESASLPDEPRMLALGLAGQRTEAHWSGTPAPAAFDYYDLKGALEALLEDLHITSVTFAPLAAPHPTYHPRRVAQILANGERLGLLGEVHPDVRAAFDLDGPAFAAELNLDLLLALAPAARHVDEVPRYPAITQDLALIVDEQVPATQIATLIQETGGALLRGVRLFDVYTGAPVPAGKRSLAFKLTFLAPERTLTDDEVSKVQQKIVRRVGEAVGATVRGA